MSPGQNFEPGEQAKGLSNMKNMSVDYSTGIFSYSIPLFELSSAHYRLPVSLVYTANGVKVEDKMGQLGFGWTLACGGVITRVVRGGIADGESKGFLNNTLTQTAEVKKRINNREQDGESDIYTAVFNGRNISFIKIREGDKIVVKPLEKTNVLIEDIDGGFQITDENGIKYIFTDKEMSVGVCFQNSNSSANNIWNSSFCSAWYLTDILIPGDEPIHFDYTEENIVDYTYHDETIYNYGKALKTREFDLSYYREEIDENLNNALYFAQRLKIEQQYAQLASEVGNMPTYVEKLNSVTHMSSYGFPVTIISTIRVPTIGMTIDYEAIAKSVLLGRVVGILADTEFTSSTCANTMTQIVQLLDVFERVKFPASCAPSASAIKGSLQNILRYMNLSIQRITSKNRHYLKDFSQQSIKEIGLRRVTWGTNCVVIERNGRLVKSIQWQNAKKDVIRNIDFSYRGKCLKRLTIGHDNSDILGYYNLEYHLDTLTSRSRDIWGYYNGIKQSMEHFIPLDQFIYSEHPFVQVGRVAPPADMDIYYDGSANEYAKAFSMKRISGSGNWSMDIDYESNVYNGEKHGGIRVKEIVLNDGTGNVDTMRYHYRDLSVSGTRGSGVLVCGYLTLSRELDYHSFCDRIYFSRVQDDEMAIVNRGNNGILYQYVLEEQVGNGYVAHYNFVPTSFRENIVQRTFFPYWLHGLPLGTAVYDSQGRLLKLQKTRYSRSLVQNIGSTYGMSDAITGEFFTGEPLFPFSTRLDQLKPYAYTMNAERIKDDFPDEEKPLYWNGAGYVNYNPYIDYYVPNVQPRENMVIPNQDYVLYYGGCVVPTEEVEYTFYDQYLQNSGVPSIADFTRASFPLKYNVTTREYTYGNLSRVTPTGVLTRFPDGSEYREENKVVMDVISDGKGHLLDSMRVAHLCYLPVKTTSFVKPVGSSTFLLSGENVVTYLDTLIDNHHYYMPFEYWCARLAQPEDKSINNQYFTLTQSCYSLEQRLRYIKFGNRILVQENQSRDKHETILYEERSGRPLFSAREVDPSGVAAFNRYIAYELKYVNLSGLPGNDVLNAVREFYVFHTSERGALGDTFLRSESHREILAVVKMILDDKVHRQNCLEEVGKLDKMLDEYEMVWSRNKDRIGMTRADYCGMVESTLQVIRLDGRNPGMMSYALCRDELGLNLSSNLTVQKITGDKYRYKLLARKGSKVELTTVSWYFSRGGTNIETGKQEFEVPAGDGFYCLEGEIVVPASAKGLPTSLQLVSGSDVWAGCLFPWNTGFTFYCYDGKGQIVSQVGPNGIIDYREYDNNGRLLRVFDKNGNILEEYGYHVNLHI